MVSKKSPWLIRSMILVLIASILMGVLLGLTDDWLNSIQISLIVVFCMLILFITKDKLIHPDLDSHSYETNELNNSSEASALKNQDRDELHALYSDLDGPSEFERMVQSVKDSFHLNVITSEEHAENQLLAFLSATYPKHFFVRKGHDSSGGKIDIVVDGSFAFNLILVTNEGRLVSLMDQVLKAKQEFVANVVILVDVDMVPVHRLQQYAEEFQQINVQTIILKGLYRRSYES